MAMLEWHDTKYTHIGDFVYDTEQWTISGGELRYIGSETDGSKIKIPEGVRRLAYTFSGRTLHSLPEIPESVEVMSNTFSNTVVPDVIDHLTIPVNAFRIFGHIYSSSAKYPIIKNLHVRKGPVDNVIKEEKDTGELISLPGALECFSTRSSMFSSDNSLSANYVASWFLLSSLSEKEMYSHIENVTCDPGLDLSSIFPDRFPSLYPEEIKDAFNNFIDGIEHDPKKLKQFCSLYKIQVDSLPAGAPALIKLVYYDVDTDTLYTARPSLYRDIPWKYNTASVSSFDPVRIKACYDADLGGLKLSFDGSHVDMISPSRPDISSLSRVVFVNLEDILNNLQFKRPTQFEWITNGRTTINAEVVHRLRMSLLYPSIEMLDKIGYKELTTPLLKPPTFGLTAWNRARKAVTKILGEHIRPLASNPAKVFYWCPKSLVPSLKDLSESELNTLKHAFTFGGGVDEEELDKDRRLEIWKACGFDPIKETHRLSNYQELFNQRDFLRLLNVKKNGKNLFTVPSLTRHLDRLDTFEAIPAEDALTLLMDYLSMCEQLNMEPRLDSDSLKREHHIASRLCRIKTSEEANKGIVDTWEEYKVYDVTSGQYLIRCIKSHEDLLDEAKQQHNCVASYADRIREKMSVIFVLRAKKDPDKSIVTIEVDPETFHLRQAYLSHNRKVTNPTINSFIRRWRKHCIKVKNKEIVPEEEMPELPEAPAVTEPELETVKKENVVVAPEAAAPAVDVPAEKDLNEIKNPETPAAEPQVGTPGPEHTL